MKFRYVAKIVLLIGFISLLSSCTNQSIPDRNEELMVEMTRLIQLESMNDAALHVADVYLNYLATINHHDPKDTVYSITNDSYFEVIAEGVVIRVKNYERKKLPKDVQLDFSIQGVRLRNGNLFAGQIAVHETAAMTESAASRSYTFTDFSVNGHQIKGINTVTYLGLNADLHPGWKIESDDTVTLKDGRWFHWKAERTRTCLNGNPIGTISDTYENALDSVRYNSNDELLFDTNLKSMMMWDHLYDVSGKTYGVDSNGRTFSTKTVDGHPLLLGNGFPFYTSGKCLFHQNNDVLLFDLGDQTKDYWVSATLFGVSMDLDMKDHVRSF